MICPPLTDTQKVVAYVKSEWSICGSVPVLPSNRKSLVDRWLFSSGELLLALKTPRHYHTRIVIQDMLESAVQLQVNINTPLIILSMSWYVLNLGYLLYNDDSEAAGLSEERVGLCRRFLRPTVLLRSRYTTVAIVYLPPPVGLCSQSKFVTDPARLADMNMLRGRMKLRYCRN